MNIRLNKLVWLLGTVTAFNAFAGKPDLPFGDTDGCMQGPLAEFGQYIGNWDIQDSSLSPDGKEWTEGKGGRWDFACLGNGTAIQDFWLPSDGKVGSNLRTYNSETGQWDIAWTVTGMAGFAHIQAKKDAKGNIVMHYKSPLPDPLRRITFFPADENGWHWKMEFAIGADGAWVEVYRIRATASE